MNHYKIIKNIWKNLEETKYSCNFATQFRETNAENAETTTSREVEVESEKMRQKRRMQKIGIR